MNKAGERLYNGLVKENPTFVLMLGMCPTLAVTTSAMNGLGMGLTTMVVLALSNLIISLLRNIIPGRVRIPAFIVIIASFVTAVQLLLEAYIPALNKSLGVYIPLIVVNCIILGRAESYAYSNPPVPSLFDGIGMGLGFTFALTCIGAVRELIGAGELFGFGLMPDSFEPVRIFGQAPGAFFVLAALVALQNYIKNTRKKKGKPYEKIGSGCTEDCASCGDMSCKRRFYDVDAVDGEKQAKSQSKERKDGKEVQVQGNAQEAKKSGKVAPAQGSAQETKKNGKVAPAQESRQETEKNRKEAPAQEAKRSGKEIPVQGNRQETKKNGKEAPAQGSAQEAKRSGKEAPAQGSAQEAKRNGKAAPAQGSAQGAKRSGKETPAQGSRQEAKKNEKAAPAHEDTQEGKKSGVEIQAQEKMREELSEELVFEALREEGGTEKRQEVNGEEELAFEDLREEGDEEGLVYENLPETEDGSEEELVYESLSEAEEPYAGDQMRTAKEER